jgi:serine protease AprX
VRRALCLLVLALVATGCTGLPASLGGGPSRTAWAFEKTGLDALHERGLDGRGVTVAIVDTGLDASHPDLKGARIAAWADLTSGKGSPYDDEGHGTHVAALVAGQSPLRGGAPGVSLIVVKVFDSGGNATDQRVADGIQFAADHGAQVIGLSLGGGTFPILGTASENAAKAAVSRGILVVAAAGNEGPNTQDVAAPADVQGVISVAAVDENLRVADFSNRGSDVSPLVGTLGLPRQAPDQKPEISAPGVKITSAWPGGGYAIASGTSMAVPYVVSALALMIQAHPGAAPSDANGVERVKGWLQSSASAVPGAARPHDRAAGYGMLDARALVDMAG